MKKNSILFIFGPLSQDSSSQLERHDRWKFLEEDEKDKKIIHFRLNIAN